MPKYRDRLPQNDSGRTFLLDGGLETTLLFHEGFDLPDFAAFVLMRDESGRAALERYFRDYAELARRYGTGFIFDSPTWRASRDWGERLGFSEAGLAELNRRSVELLLAIRDSMDSASTPGLVSGCLGPRGDGYFPDRLMGAEEAADYHLEQLRTFAETEADMVSAYTLGYAEEAIGIALASNEAGMPVSLSFTVETDGRLPSGQPLLEAIAAVDEATGSSPAYYMINCAHPVHFEPSLANGGKALSRLRGIRANASRKSHEELNESTELDSGDPSDLGGDFRRLKTRFPEINVLGGCCGTDRRHIESICKAVFA